ncbi:HNH endonuclease [Thiomonas sp.]
MTAQVLQLDIRGEPRAWIGLEDAAAYYATDRVAWSWGDPMTLLHGGINRRRGQQSLLEIHPVIAVKGQRFFHDHPPHLTNETLFARDEHLCLYCGQEFPKSRLTRDHIQPVSRGGRNAWMNVVSACTACNARKDNRTPEEANMPLLAVPFAPNHAEYLYLRASGRILADQMDFLKARFKHPRMLT